MIKPVWSRKVWQTILSVAVVTLLALGLRLRAVERLPIDYDEDDYLATAEHYARAIAAGDLAAVTEYAYVQEHPLLAKLVYAAVLLPLPPASPLIPELDPSQPPAHALPQPHFLAARLTAAVLGSLTVALLAAFNPLAGLFLSMNTWVIKYTSQVMLESFTSLVALLTALCYLRWRPRPGERPAGRRTWLALSAVMLGLTAASKYVYALVGVAILIDWLWLTFPAGAAAPRRAARWLAPAVGWGVLAVAVFIAADPHLWPDPLGRLAQSVLYWPKYSASAAVSSAGYPLWQPLVWLAGPVPWHPGVFIFLLDLPITLLAIAGFRRLWQRERVLALWLGLALAFLLWWTTKWPQYILVLMAPLSVAAAHGFQQVLAEPFGRWFAARRRAGP